ncbi:MAG: hydrogenase expression/formation protein HypC [Pseudonocardiales bacterium]|jgi:hydrogenase expression/formation protein HypC|uniref:HypC/HybG/HupF family hydrogenase formation chaperone n=1 Tax=Pseudonocardia sp. Cha107L01 TaxID=3457576 RepID=UPI0028CA65A5|nr:hydrogenase expression/formation protein HypC [Pseudonocardiales bacterium]HEV7792074.1 HypC/HybG/HupF family hydrogenase formation chaperone [Pseudonocardia sp.]MDT7562909.1 hydrogenase expression/formation protein HypC [Pseudonocardiales bacterium]MDT7611034.1 hydrogenase expression/formation protein HypC [Pseudonocardiales bacterium]MDT7624880.1 hydrogenase expression/formation protein HypC [Pseudonocardiales bacterium]
MCLGIPGEIVELLADREDFAMVSVAGVKRVVNIGLLEDEELKAGDWILIHVGFALSKIDEAEATHAIRMLEGMGQAYTDELIALAKSDLSE